MSDARLRLYVNDHLSATVAIQELARRSRRRNRRGSLAAALEDLVAALTEDRALLKRILTAYGAGEDRIKQGGAWLLEKLGRLKLNDSVFRYTDLDRVYELEALIASLYGRRALFRTLFTRKVDDERLRDIDLETSEARNEDFIRRFEEERVAAAALAFGLEAPAEAPAP